MMKSAFCVADWQFHRPPETVTLSRESSGGSERLEVHVAGSSFCRGEKRQGWEITHTNWEGATQASPPRLPANCLIE